MLFTFIVIFLSVTLCGSTHCTTLHEEQRKKIYGEFLEKFDKNVTNYQTKNRREITSVIDLKIEQQSDAYGKYQSELNRSNIVTTFSADGNVMLKKEEEKNLETMLIDPFLFFKFMEDKQDPPELKSMITTKIVPLQEQSKDLYEQFFEPYITLLFLSFIQAKYCDKEYNLDTFETYIDRYITFFFLDTWIHTNRSFSFESIYNIITFMFNNEIFDDSAFLFILAWREYNRFALSAEKNVRFHENIRKKPIDLLLLMQNRISVEDINDAHDQFLSLLNNEHKIKEMNTTMLEFDLLKQLNALSLIPEQWRKTYIDLLNYKGLLSTEELERSLRKIDENFFSDVLKNIKDNTLLDAQYPKFVVKSIKYSLIVYLMRICLSTSILTEQLYNPIIKQYTAQWLDAYWQRDAIGESNQKLLILFVCLQSYHNFHTMSMSSGPAVSEAFKLARVNYISGSVGPQMASELNEVVKKIELESSLTKELKKELLVMPSSTSVSSKKIVRRGFFVERLTYIVGGLSFATLLVYWIYNKLRIRQ